MAASTEYLNKINECKPDIIKRLNSGESITKISKIYKFDRNTISKRLGEWNIREFIKLDSSPFSRSDVQTNRNKIDFSNIEKETEEGCYWLGFILADGYIKNSRFELGLAEIDLNHLNKFSDFLNLDKLPRYRANTNSYRVSFNNKEFNSLLKRKGIIERKSYVDFSLYIPKNYLNFARGILDGDGCYCLEKNRKLSISCVGNIVTMEFLKLLFGRGSIYHAIEKADNVWCFSTSYTVTSKDNIPSWITDSKNYYLDRKVDKINQFCRLQEKSRRLLSEKNGESHQNKGNTVLN